MAPPPYLFGYRRPNVLSSLGVVETTRTFETIYTYILDSPSRLVNRKHINGEISTVFTVSGTLPLTFVDRFPPSLGSRRRFTLDSSEIVRGTEVVKCRDNGGGGPSERSNTRRESGKKDTSGDRHGTVTEVRTE